MIKIGRGWIQFNKIPSFIENVVYINIYIRPNYINRIIKLSIYYYLKQSFIIIFKAKKRAYIKIVFKPSINNSTHEFYKESELSELLRSLFKKLTLKADKNIKTDFKKNDINSSKGKISFTKLNDLKNDFIKFTKNTIILQSIFVLYQFGFCSNVLLDIEYDLAFTKILDVLQCLLSLKWLFLIPLFVDFENAIEAINVDDIVLSICKRFNIFFHNYIQLQVILRDEDSLFIQVEGIVS